MNFRTPNGQDPLDGMGAFVWGIVGCVCLVLVWVIFKRAGG